MCQTRSSMLIGLAILTIAAIASFSIAGYFASLGSYKWSNEVKAYNKAVSDWQNSRHFTEMNSIAKVEVKIYVNNMFNGSVVLTKQSEPRKMTANNSRYDDKPIPRSKIAWWKGELMVPTPLNFTVEYVIDGTPLANSSVPAGSVPVSFNSKLLDNRANKPFGTKYYPAIFCRPVVKNNGQWFWSTEVKGDGCEQGTNDIKPIRVSRGNEVPEFNRVRFYNAEPTSIMTFELLHEADPWIAYMEQTRSTYDWPFIVGVDFGAAFALLIATGFFIGASICSVGDIVIAIVHRDMLKRMCNGEPEPDHVELTDANAQQVNVQQTQLCTAVCEHCQFTFQYYENQDAVGFTCPQCQKTTSVGAANA
eukprot:TRINITY_DN1513_c0_g1_i1.p1 TRINITY_DN1513_c0_g1~~TRINITY_DN1513_c0_g1_i1.p1  ORF type:complete len:380 (+),score=75.08 TRINITY_DN1513_c0_g1_i1:53-1141(+)